MEALKAEATKLYTDGDYTAAAAKFGEAIKAYEDEAGAGLILLEPQRGTALGCMDTDSSRTVPPQAMVKETNYRDL